MKRMNKLSVIIAFFAFIAFSYGQKVEKREAEHKVNTEDLKIQKKFDNFPEPRSSDSKLGEGNVRALYMLPQGASVKSKTPVGKPSFITFHSPKPEIRSSAQAREKAIDKIARIFRIDNPEGDYELLNVREEGATSHAFYRQTLNGLAVYGSEFAIHAKNGRLYAYNGIQYSGVEIVGEPSEAMTKDEAVEVLEERHFANSNTSKIYNNENRPQYLPDDHYELLYYTKDVDADKLQLAWHVEFHPNPSESWTIILDAKTGEIIEKYDRICRFTHEEIEEKHNVGSETLPLDGPKTSTAKDLLGVNRTVHYYEISNTGVLIDVSRDMFPGGAPDPDDPQGVIWTVDGNNGFPGGADFQVSHLTSTDGYASAPDAVSAHYNASASYEYFKNTFGRNSIDGSGGRIISLINIDDQDGSELDNAFWNGAAIFYGSGKTAFKHLARGLDVAGHEMTHGVIQATSNLEYVGESGAINESMADVFGAMIDRNDWGLGEDVVTNFFPTGKMRDMADPHNGGNTFSDRGYQPAHYNERYTGSEDNGGVHINSGITNKAFFFLATEIGKDKAEQIYYETLTTYLHRRSNFKDLRAAVEQSAMDLYGNAEVNAAKDAFADVGIGEGGSTQGGGGEIDENEGDDLIVVVDEALNEATVVNPNGQIIVENFLVPNINTKPSVSDDGSIFLYVNDNQQIMYKEVDWENSLILGEGVLIDNKDQNGNSTPWGNVAISPSGRRMAFVSANAEKFIYFYDFVLEEFQQLELHNPTFSEGLSTGALEYADALCFNHSGEFLIYDAFNTMNSGLGEDIEFWDIAYAEVFNNETNNWAGGRIFSMFGSLPSGVSVGNPQLAKNSEDAMCFDYLDESGFSSEFYIATSNLSSGESYLIHQNNVVGWPSYSRLDDFIVFTSLSGGNYNTSYIPMNSDRVTTGGSASQQYQGVWANWFSTGERSLGTESVLTDTEFVKVYPNPARDQVRVEIDKLGMKITELKIIGSNGKIHFPAQLSSTQSAKVLNVSNLSPGMYFLELTTEEGKVRKGFVKQ